MRITTLLVLTMATALAVCGCGNGDPDDGGTSSPTSATPRARMEAARLRIAKLRTTPWLGTLLTIRQPLIDLHSRLHNALSGGTENEAALLARIDALGPLLDKLDEVGPNAQRVWQAERSCAALLDQLAIPDATPFPLRTRLKEGWLKDRGTHFGYLITGLESLMNGREHQSLDIALGNLPRLATEGEAVFHELNGLSRVILVLDAKLKNLEGKVIPWGDKLLRAGDDQGKLKPDERADLAEAIANARTALPALVARWTPLRLEALQAAPETMKAVTALIKEADAVKAQMYRVGNPLAVRLKMVDFRRGK